MKKLLRWKVNTMSLVCDILGITDIIIDTFVYIKMVSLYRYGEDCTTVSQSCFLSTLTVRYVLRLNVSVP